MHRNLLRVSVSLLLLLSLIGVIRLIPSNVSALSLSTATQDPPTIFVWSNACRSSNITKTNPLCGTLAVGSSISVELNITNAPKWNGFDLFLYYDIHFINATGFDESQTLFTNAFEPAKTFAPGVVHLAAVNLDAAHPTLNATGTIAHIFFKILASGATSLTLAAGMLNPSTIASSYTVITLGSTPIDVLTSNGYFKNDQTKLGPVASFSITPSAPTSLDLVTFNASTTIDLDASVKPGIRYYEWDYGDGTGLNGSSAVVTHAYPRVAYGNFSVRLTVVDTDEGFSAIAVQRLYVAQLQTHDISLSLGLSSSAVDPGTKITVTVTVTDDGTYSENFNLTVFYESPRVILEQSTGHVVTTSKKTATFPYTIDTTGLAPGAYTVSATASIAATDPTPRDNSNQQTFNVNQPGTGFTYLLFAAGVVVVVAAMVTVVTLLRRRRRKADSGLE